MEAAVIYLIFIITNALVGYLLYNLGLHGRVLGMQKQMGEVKEPDTERKKKEPTSIPGENLNPYGQGYKEYIPPSANDYGLLDAVNPYDGGDEDDGEDDRGSH